MKVIDVTPASIEDLCKFHSPLYIEFLKKISHYFTNTPKEDRDLVAEELDAESQDFGIGLLFMKMFLFKWNPDNSISLRQVMIVH